MSLPTELLLDLATYLSPGNVARLLRTCRQARDILRSFLYGSLLRRAISEGERSSEGQDTPLHSAASSGMVESVRSLLDTGLIGINCQDSEGETAVHLAARDGHCSTIELLLQRGVPVDLRNAWSETPLMHAALGGYTVNAVKLLMDRGADPNARSNSGSYLAALVAGRGVKSWLEKVRLLADGGADMVGGVNGVNSVLHCSCVQIARLFSASKKAEGREALRFMFERCGAALDVWAYQTAGTPRHYFLHHGGMGMTEALIELGYLEWKV